MKKIAFSIFLLFSCAAYADELADANKLLENKSYPQALELYKKLAQSGNAEAQFHLGERYGRGGNNGLEASETESRVESYKWFTLAAAQGFQHARLESDSAILRMTPAEVTEGNRRVNAFVALVIIARLKKFDRSLEDAAYNLGANRFEVIWHITLKYLRPSIISGAAVAFLLSFENFNTTLFLIGSKPTLPIALFAQIRDGGTPVVNAVSVLLMFCMSIIW